MSDKLHIDSVRNVLIRLEETIIFALIERGQFMQNRVIYDPGRFGSVLEGESLVGFMLLETERSHAKVRRYSGSEEHPFFDNLPQPILPPLHISDNPIRENNININRTIRRIYENDIVNHICAEGDDNEYGSSAVCDVSCLQSISKRIHYGKFVAESKFRKAGNALLNAINNCDKEAIMSSITDDSVEAAVLKRVSSKAHTYTQELAGTSAAFTVDPETVVDIYRKWIIPLNKQVQVEYLLQSCANHQ